MYTFIYIYIYIYIYIQKKAYFRDFRVLGQVSCEVQGFQGPLDLFKGFQGKLHTLHLRDKLVLYFCSKSSTL